MTYSGIHIGFPGSKTLSFQNMLRGETHMLLGKGSNIELKTQWNVGYFHGGSPMDGTLRIVSQFLQLTLNEYVSWEHQEEWYHLTSRRILRHTCKNWSLAQELIKISGMKLNADVQHYDELHPLKLFFMLKFGTFRNFLFLSLLAVFLEDSCLRRDVAFTGDLTLFPHMLSASLLAGKSMELGQITVQ